MKPYIQPVPDGQPEPAEQPAPVEHPRRRTITLPTFTAGTTFPGVKTFSTMVLIMGFMGAQAQTQPVPDPPSTPGVPTRPMDPDDRPMNPAEPQKPLTPQTPTSDGWIMFDDRSTKDLGLEKDQLQRLRDVDGSYSKDYTGLGNTPTKNPRYHDLSERRNKDVRNILTPDQYDRWMHMRRTPDERMDRDTDGGMKHKSTPDQRERATGTVRSASETSTTPAPKPTTAPKN